MKENQKDSTNQQDQKGQYSDKSGQSNKSQKPSDVKLSTEDTVVDKKNKEGTKMPRNETRTPVAGGKSAQEKTKTLGNLYSLLMTGKHL